MADPIFCNCLAAAAVAAISGRRDAGVAKLVDATDLKSVGPQGLYRFDSGRPHQSINHGLNAGPFGLMRTPGRSRVHGSVAVSAGIAPGAAQISSVSAIGSKSARKCTELLLTRIACSVGSMPT